MKFSIVVLIAYTILTLLLTYPVAFSPNEFPGHGDAFWFLWDFWWFKTSLFDISSPYYTYYIFYPNGVSLASSTITPLNAIVSIPLQLAFGLIGAYKIIWILSFILSGFSAFLLVRYLVGDSRAAFVSGLIFMVCPYHFAHALGHMNLISIQWIPLYVLFLVKTINENNRSNAFLAALFLFLNATSCYYYLIYLILFTAIYLAYILLSYKDICHLKTIRKIGIMILSFTIIFMPVAYPVIKEMINSKYIYYGGFVEYSADFLGFFIPSVFHPIFKDFVSPIYSNFTGNAAEHTVFAGYTVILLASLAIIKIKTKDVKFWALSSVTFLVLSLGPILHINGIVKICLDGYETYIPLPYVILMQIPVVSLTRVPSRWTVLLILSLAVLAGYGLKHMFSRYNDSRQRNNENKINVIFIIVSCLVIFEFLAIPYLMSSSDVPPFYKEIAAEEEDFALLEVPMLWQSDLMYYQTIHGKRLIGGYASRIPENSINFLIMAPLINDLLNFYPSDKDILNQNLADVGPSIMNYYNVKYIILHPDRMTSDQLEFAKDTLHRSINVEPTVYENDSMIVYEVFREPANPFIQLKNGWHGLEDWDSTPTRWMENEATIMIYSDENRTADLSFKARSFYYPRNLEILINDIPHICAKVPSESFVVVNAPTIRLNEGANIVRFHVPGGCERPRDITELNNADPRCLSVAVQNIIIY